MRYSGGRPIFLLSELLNWTLPDNDKHARYRLSVVASCNIATNRLAAERFKRERQGSSTRRGGSRPPASVNRELQLLSRIFSLAIDRGELQLNPCKGVRLCPVIHNVTRYLTPHEESRLLSVLTGRRAHVLDVTTIDLYTGMRLREILTLHRGQVDLVRRSIELTRTKSGKPRSVPIHPGIKPVFERLMRDAGPSGYLFENPRTGKPLSEIKTAWRTALREAGIQNLRFHDLRDTFGTRAADGGAHIKDIQAVMGHADVRTTMRYIHGTDEGRRRVVEAAVSGARQKSSATNMPRRRSARR